MDRAAYAFHPLSWEQYQQVIQHGSFPNVPEPMLNRADYDSLIAVLSAANIDPRLPLAFTWAEGHDGTDPGLVAASVNNLGGIKFAGTPGTTDSGIPADTGGTYAAFPDLTAYWQEWVRIMNNSIIGPDFNSGNLIGAVEHYTNGPGTGHNKVDQFLAYQRDYPPEGATVTQFVYPVDAPIVQGSDGTFSHGGRVPGFYALDFSCVRGTPVRAIADGTVGKLFTTDSNPISLRTGPSIWIDHADGWASFSCHMSRIDVAVGDAVTQGQTIGLSGDPRIDGGFGDGAHLHFELWHNGTRVKAETLLNAANPSPQPPQAPQFVIDGYDVGEGIYTLYTSVSAVNAARLRIFGRCRGAQHDEYLITDAPAPLNKRADPVVAVEFERVTVIWDKGRTPAPFDTRIALATEVVAPADNVEVIAVLTAMRLAGVA